MPLHLSDVLYLSLLTMLFAATYVVLFFFFPKFFAQPAQKLQRKSIHSIISIIAIGILVFFISYAIPDPALGNRFLHAIGGGFLAMLICFLAAWDSRVSLSRFQLISISFLISTFLGVGNEIAEFALQSITGFPFTDSLTDTWLDLLSNTVGALLASVSLLPLIKNRP